jgi:hypothetical protein
MPGIGSSQPGKVDQWFPQWAIGHNKMQIEGDCGENGDGGDSGLKRPGVSALNLVKGRSAATRFNEENYPTGIGAGRCPTEKASPPSPTSPPSPYNCPLLDLEILWPPTSGLY